MKQRVSIIGYGRFGSLAARYLKSFSTVEVHDRKMVKKRDPGVKAVSLRRAALADVIIFAVPIGELEALVKRIAPIINRNALVVDVCSVKEEPIRWMSDHLPPSVSLLGTHPLFGPSSISAGLTGKTVILCPVRIRKTILTQLQTGMKRAGLRVQCMTPARHDRLIAKTLFVTQYLGRIARPVIGKNDFPTKAFQYLRGIVDISANDSSNLLRDVYRYNRFVPSLHEGVRSAMRKVDASLISSKNMRKTR